MREGARMAQNGKPGLDDLHLFHLVQEAGSISGAARRGGMSKATLSRAIARLEDVAGAPLFDRVGTGLQLTQSGGALLDAAGAASRVLAEAEEVLRAAHGEPHGDLRIAASALSAQQLLGPVVAEMHRRHPAVRTHVTVTGLGPDPLSENLDVVLRLGRPDEAHLIARRILAAPLRLYVSASRETPLDLRDAAAVEAAGRIAVDVPGVPIDWVLHDNAGKPVRMAAPPMATVGDPTVALGILASGHGVAFLPSLFGDPLVASGELLRALPDHEGPKIEIFACFPPRRASIPAVRAFIDLLADCAKARANGA
ncbi:LysR family transcriptional regulator [Roseovarius aquimarinus]|uniref:LysR family transcriptional regulator n=1 Tax=Roseovarius aquimarinus TaxID=1229156 RepID=A0ABW7I8H3_9RHOB